MQRLLIFPSARARACSRMRAIEGDTGGGPGRCAAVATTIVPCKHCSWDSQQFSCGACVQAESRLASVVSVASVLLCWRHGVLSAWWALLQLELEPPVLQQWQWICMRIYRPCSGQICQLIWRTLLARHHSTPWCMHPEASGTICEARSVPKFSGRRLLQ